VTPAPTRRGHTARLRDRLLLAGAVVLALCAIVYNWQVLLPTSARFARQMDYTQGNLSDLYSRWYGSREVLQHGRDPYSTAMTEEMQIGFYGRAARPGEVFHIAAIYAQPIYTAFLLAPLTLLDFGPVQAGATWVVPLLIALGVLLWAHVLQPRLSPAQVLMIGVVGLAAPPTLEAARVQQLTGLVFFLVALAVFLLTRQRYLPAGILLALSTIKPQENWTIIAVLGVWVLGDWRARRALAGSFAATLLVLSLAGEVVLPGWLFKFAPALVAYNQIAEPGQVFLHFLPWALLAACAAGWAMLLAWAAWRARKDPPRTPRFGITLVFALAVAQVILPTNLLYEGVYLLPGLLVLIWTRDAWRARPALRMASGLVLAALLWPLVTVATLGGLEALGFAIHDASTVLQFLPWQIASILPGLCAGTLVCAVATAPDALRARRRPTRDGIIADTTGPRLAT
jgi:hypothetical protein